MALDNEKVYWANHGYYSANSPTLKPIYMVSKQGGKAEIFADQQTIPHSLVVDEKFVYWLTSNGIVKQAKSGGQPQVLYQVTTKEDVDEIINLQPLNKYAKPYQVKQVRELLIRYKLIPDGRSEI